MLVSSSQTGTDPHQTMDTICSLRILALFYYYTGARFVRICKKSQPTRTLTESEISFNCARVSFLSRILRTPRAF